MKFSQPKNIESTTVKHSPFFQKRGNSDLWADNHRPFFNYHSIQPKLTIKQPNDQYEKEADNMADQVVQRLSDHNAVPSSPTTPLIQTKCAACEQEEKLQKKEEEEEKELIETKLQRKPIFESNVLPEEDTVQRKCAECEKEEKLQKKGNNSSALTASPSMESSLASSKGSGSPLPADTRQQMESSFGADFSNVRIHNDTSSVQMNKDLNAQAFTHGSDIYFNSEKYNTTSTSGKHLLAHELTHTMQQGASSIQRKPSPQPSTIHYTNNLIQTYPQAGEQLPSTDKQAKYYSHRNDVVDIMGASTFDPGRGLGNYIASLWENHQDAPVNIKFGSLASGFIWIKQSGSYYSKECYYIPVSLILGVKVCRDSPPETSNYYAAPQVIPFEHPDIDTKDKNGTLVLIVGIEAGVIWGKLGWIEGKTKDAIDPLLDATSATTAPESLYPLIFGKEHAEKTFTPNPALPFTNILKYGLLKLFVLGDLNVDHQQKLSSYFMLYNKLSFWSGSLKTNIQGAEQYDLPIKRTPQGYLSGESNELTINKNWKGEGFTASAGLQISYANANLSVTGTASYKSKRASGSVTISITDQETAQRLFLQHVPAQRIDVEPEEEFLDTALPDPEKPLALTGWGKFHLTVITKGKKLEADAAFVVSPEGYVVTAGQVKLQQDYTLMDMIEKSWNPYKIEKSVTIYPWGVPVTFSGSGSLSTGYSIGDITFVELLASGVYSTHPDYASELCLAGTFDMPAVFWASLQVKLAAAIGISGYSLVEVGVGATGTALLNVYVRATPSIGIIKKQGESPDYCIGGKLYIGGQLQLKVFADFSFSIFKISKDENDKVEKKLIGKKTPTLTWTIGDFGAELAVEYILGSGEKPDFKYSGKDFDQNAFLKALGRSKSNKAKRDKAVKGGFKEEEGEEKGAAQETPFDPLHPGNEPVGPYAITDSFQMNGIPHTLILTVKGTKDAPEAELEMQSEREKLNQKIDEEILLLNALLISPNIDLSEAEERKVRRAISDLENIKAEGTRATDSARELAAETNPSDEAVEHVGDMLSNYGDRFDRQDLGVDNPSQPPAPAGGVKVPPSGVDVVLRLPKQKSVHLALYQKYIADGELYHSINRAARDTDQVNKWNQNMEERIGIPVACRSVALGLYLAGQDDPARNLLRPYWTPKRVLGKNVRGDQMRMTVDHVIEYQLRPLTDGGWIDGPWNFELLEPSANSSAGPKLDSNIEKERQRLAKLTGDNTWLTDDIKFTKVEVDSMDRSAERYSETDIENGKHLSDYKRLTGEVEDRQVYDDCKKKGPIRY